MSEIPIQDFFNQALQHHQAGQLDIAWNMYRQLLNHLPDHPDILRLMGLISNQTGQFPQAEQLLKKAISLKPHDPQFHLDLSDSLQAQGKFAESEQACRQSLSLNPNNAAAWNSLGNALISQGKPHQAAEHYRKATLLQPDFLQAFANLGNALNQLDQLEESLNALGKAKPLKNPEVYLNLGLVLKKLNRLDEAIAATREAVALAPTLAKAHNNLGNLLMEKGWLDQAVARFKDAVALNPDYPQAFSNLGNALFRLNRLDESLPALFKALSLKADPPQTLLTLGLVLSQLNRLDEAIQSLRQSLALSPNQPLAHHHLGRLYYKKGLLPQAEEHYRHAIAAQPDYSDAYSDLGALLLRMNRTAESIQAHQKAVELSPESAAFLCGLGCALHEAKRFDEAIVAYKKAIELDPNLDAAYNNLANALKEIGLLAPSIQAYRKAIELNPHLPFIQSNLLMTLHYDPNTTLEEEKKERTLWAQRHADSLCTSPAQKPTTQPDRLKIGFVSTDFHRHPIGRFLLPLLAHLDKTRFSIICYSDSIVHDDITQQLQSHADLWIESAFIPHDHLNQRIRDDGVHILIDLGAHSAGNRLPVFAQKPAPVQISWLAYCGSTGLKTIDFRISDPHMDPGQFDAWHTEKTLRLPHTYWCYPPPTDAPMAPPPLTLHKSITFGCLNAFCKISPLTLKCWTSILGQLPDSQLKIYAPEGSSRNRVIETFQNAGIDPSRIGFHAFASHEAYFNVYNQIDIVLDPFPYNGGTTSLDALWMGVPIITLCGDRPVGRAGLSILSNLGLTEYVATTPDQYIQKAFDLANHPEKLAELRMSLRNRMQNSPLMNAPQFAQDFAALLIQAWNT